MQGSALIDDFSLPDRASNGQHWRYFSDRVMGGVSEGGSERVRIDGRDALRLHGEVSLENNGGFVQLALDLAGPGAVFDASRYRGIAITLHGDGGTYAVNLRTAELRYPWQSYRCALRSAGHWQRHTLPFESFEAHRTDRPLDPRRLRRVGLIAIGEARRVDVAIAELCFYGD